jgi:hypothetical protein
MKKIALNLLLICFATMMFAQSETRKLDSFDEISVATGISATLVKSNENKVEITAENVDMDKIITEVKGDRLNVKIKSNNWGWSMKKRKVEATIYYTEELHYIAGSSGARVESRDAISTDNMRVNSSSGARVELTLESDMTSAEASSGATIELTGTSAKLKADASSGASIRAKDLMSQKADADVSSGASIDIWVEKELIADASSGGSVKYKGSPSSVDVDKSSGGSVKKRD